jgi:hypothetical protein
VLFANFFVMSYMIGGKKTKQLAKKKKEVTKVS